MSRIDPDNVVVLVRDSSNNIVRIGVADWREQRATETAPLYQGVSKSDDDPPIVGTGMGLCSGPGLDLGLGVTRGGTQPEC